MDWHNREDRIKMLDTVAIMISLSSIAISILALMS